MCVCSDPATDQQGRPLEVKRPFEKTSLVASKRRAVTEARPGHPSSGDRRRRHSTLPLPRLPLRSKSPQGSPSTIASKVSHCRVRTLLQLFSLNCPLSCSRLAKSSLPSEHMIAFLQLLVFWEVFSSFRHAEEVPKGNDVKPCG